MIIDILECDQFDTCVYNGMNMCVFCISVIIQKMWQNEVAPNALCNVLFSLEQVLQMVSQILLEMLYCTDILSNPLLSF